MSDYIPERGDIVEINFTPQAGHEQRGRRPAIVISMKIYNEKTGLCIVCPITSKMKGYPFEIILPDVLKTQGVILSDQVKNLDWKKRNARYIEKASDEMVKQTLEKLFLLMKY